MTLIFDENGRYLSLAQEALWRMRQRFGWVCVAAEGIYSCVALSLAAQLPVDRLALMNSGLFMRRREDAPRELMRLAGYARRNLSLVVSEILLIRAENAEIRGFERGRNRGKLCVLEGKPHEWDCSCLTEPWEGDERNGLIIPRKYV